MEEIFMKQLLKFPLLEAKEAYKGYWGTKGRLRGIGLEESGQVGLT